MRKSSLLRDGNYSLNTWGINEFSLFLYILLLLWRFPTYVNLSFGEENCTYSFLVQTQSHWNLNKNTKNYLKISLHTNTYTWKLSVSHSKNSPAWSLGVMVWKYQQVTQLPQRLHLFENSIQFKAHKHLKCNRPDFLWNLTISCAYVCTYACIQSRPQSSDRRMAQQSNTWQIFARWVPIINLVGHRFLE